jgi:hypothetical protein
LKGVARSRARPSWLVAPLLALVVLLPLAAAHGAEATVSAVPERAIVERLDPATQQSMIGVTWNEGCPVALRDLRRVVVPFVDFSGTTQRGALVVHRDVAAAVGRIFVSLYSAGFPIASIEPIEKFGGDDDRSTLANNTSAFNCRPSFGADGAPTKRWSQHAFGRAIDVNPVQNPYVLADGSVLDPAARPFLDRRRGAPGMAVRGGVLVKAFAANGWKWGGNWRSTKDYQHFSVTGR